MLKVGLLDCNNFFVSCERLFRPDLVGKPVAVLSSNDGCIVARSQEVKDMGIPMGAPYFKVRELCDSRKVTLFSGNLTFYRDISARVMDVLEQEVGVCEVYSVDEAFFSLPEDTSLLEVKKIRDVVSQKVGIPVSVGVAQSKTLAKVAGGIGKKEDGYYILTMPDWEAISQNTSTGSVWVLGRATVEKLTQMQVKTARDFMELERSMLRQKFGVGTERVYDELQGKRVFTVGKNSEALRQSIASTRSFASETTSMSDLKTAVAGHVVQVAEKLRARGLCASRIQVQLLTNRYGDFFMQGGSGEVVLEVPTFETAVLLKVAMRQVELLYTENVPYKKVGVTTGGLLPETCRTQNLFETVTYEKGVLDTLTDVINARYGRGTLKPGRLLDSGMKSNAQLRSPNYTTVWKDIPTVAAK